MILQRVQYSAVVQSTERLLLGLTDCKYGGKRVKRGVFSVLCAKLVKCVLEQLTVMVHIAIASR